MNKFFRKYNKWLLAVFGSGLMVIFLMPQIPELVSNMGLNRAVVATVDGEAITREELISYQEQATIIDRLQDQGSMRIPFVGNIDGWEQWYLLVREARQAGMVGGSSTSPLTEEQTIQTARGFGVSPAVVQQTWANYMGVLNYLSHMGSSAPLSDRRLRGNGRKLFDMTTARVVSIKADTPSTAITHEDDALQAHLDQWGDTEPGEGDHGFGYRLPDRASIEWFRIPDTAIRQSLESSEAMDEIELLKYWRRNEGENNIPIVKPGAPVPDAVRTQLLDELTEQRRDEVARKAADQLRTPRRGFSESNGFIILPEDWSSRQLTLDTVRDQLQIDYGMELPVVEGTESLTATTELRKLEGIGLASTTKFGQRAVNLTNLVQESKEFGGTGLYPIQEGIAGPVLKDNKNNLYVFRIAETDAARPPADVDEAREQLTADLDRLAHYEELVASLDALREQARTDGLDSIAESNGERVQGASFRLYDPRFAQLMLQSQGTVPRSNQIIPGLGRDEDVVSVVLDRAESLQQSGSLADVSEADRTDAIPSEQNLAIVIVQLNDQTPLTIDEFTTMTETGVLPTIIMQEELAENDSVSDAFTLEALMERNRFERAEEDEDVLDADATATAAEPTADSDSGS
jgi:hypothetical protein